MRERKAAKPAPGDADRGLRGLVRLGELNGPDARSAASARQAAAALFVHAITPDPVNRHPHDFYVTPRAAIDALLDHEPIVGPVWDPCCGTGAISRALIHRGITVVSSDLHNYGYGEAGWDFLGSRRPGVPINTILMNPPFRAAQQFVERALSLNVKKVVSLARLTWLESQRRRPFFQATPLARIWVHSGRQNVSRAGVDYGHGGMIAFAWFTWELGYRGRPYVGWLP